MPQIEVVADSEGQVDRKVNLVGAANRIGVTPATIRYWILTDALPAAKIGGQWVIDLADVDRVDQEKRDIGWGRRGKRGHVVPASEGVTEE